MLKVILKSGNKFIIETKKGGPYWNFKSDRNITYKNIPLDSTISRGYWKDYDGGALAPDIIKRAKKAQVIDLTIKEKKDD